VEGSVTFLPLNCSFVAEMSCLMMRTYKLAKDKQYLFILQILGYGLILIKIFDESHICFNISNKCVKMYTPAIIAEVKYC
jgi:hypothetical protein